ncbi:MAG: WD40/YVTN/BNR-like repeat-containing protein, partial [Ignavibacteria bacterium]
MKKVLPLAAVLFVIIVAAVVSFTVFDSADSGKESEAQNIKELKTSTGIINQNKNLPEEHSSISSSAANNQSNLIAENRNNQSLDEKEFYPKGVNPADLKNDNQETTSANLTKKAMMGLVSQRKLFIKGGDRSDRPDLFREWQVGIRTKDGETAPGYRYNYQMKELSKSKSQMKSLSKGAGIQQLTVVERGPGNVSGRTRGIIIDPDDPTLDTWFTGSVSGGIWKTTNEGTSWTNLTPDLPNLATSTLAMAESDHNIIYAGTGEGFFNVDQVDGSGIWKSTDKGVTWDPLASTVNDPNFENITRLVVDPADENIVLASAVPGFNYQSFAALAPSSKIFRSTDGGTTWDAVYDAGLNSIEQIVVDPTDFNIQYATVNGTGIIKSTDAGLTWNDASNGIGGVLRMELAISPSDPSTLYFSAEGGESGSILYVSDDGAENWFAMADTSGFDVPWLGGQGWYDNTIAVDPYDKNKIYVGGINLWRLDRVAGSDTSDEQITDVEQINTSSFLSFVNWGGRYAGGGLDLGEVFHGLNTDLDESEYTTVEIRFGPGLSQKAHSFTFAAGFLYPYLDYVDVPFEVWDTDNNRQLMVSFRDHDGSGTWNPLDQASAPGGISREYIFINAVAYDENNPDTNIAQTAGMAYKNTYAFWPEAPAGTVFDPNNLPSSMIRINWGTFITYKLAANVVTDGYGQYGGTTKGVHVDHHNILLVPTNFELQQFRLVNGNDGGVSFSDDKGETFLQPKNGYNTTQFYGVDKMNGADRYIGGTQDNGTFVSPENPDNMSAWEEAPSGDGFEAVWHYNNPDLILESSQFNNIFKSTDRGLTWNSAGAANGLDANGPFLTKLAKSKQDPDLVFAVAGSGVYRSDDFADSWTQTAMPPEFNGVSSFSEVKISLVDPQIVWAGQGMSATSRLYVSKDGGLSFDTTVIHTDVTLGRISGLETDPADDSTAYALFSFAKTSKILKTTDLGQTWTDISGFGTDTVSSEGFPDVAVFCLLVMPYDTDIIWAGTEIGIFQTTDGGSDWELLGEGFPPVAVHEMVIVNDEVVAATHGRGIWSITVPELAGYEPPAPDALSPRLSPIAQGPTGLLVIPFALRSAYDSSHVLINNEVFNSLAANSSEVDTIIYYPVTQTRTDSVQIVGYKNGRTFKSYMRISDDKVLGLPVTTYINDFSSDTTSFAGTGFTISQQFGFK